MIGWDANAGALLRPQVAATLAQAFATPLGNPASLHALGRAARRRLDAARDSVAARFGCLPREVVFTGSGSESAALAVLGTFAAQKAGAARRFVTSSIEHPCVLGAADRLAAQGVEVVRVPPDPSGVVPLEALEAALTPGTTLCSLMAVNNETGVVQPAAEVARRCAARGILFHCDAVQAVGKVPCTLREVPADLLTFSAHKLGGPAGVGVLLNRRGVAVQGLVPGHQENGRRGGTPSVALIEGLALALELALAEEDVVGPRVTALRDAFEAGLRRAVPDAVINGRGPRVGNTSNVWFPGVDGEALLIALDLDGICVSTGAACASGSTSPSHVLTAMGLTAAQAHGSLRFSLPADATAADVETVLAALARHAPRAREA